MKYINENWHKENKWIRGMEMDYRTISTKRNQINESMILIRGRPKT